MRTKGSIAKSREFPANKLAALLKPIHEQLKNAGIPEVRIPTNDAILSLLLEWVDEDKVNDWILSLTTSMGTRGARIKAKKKIAQGKKTD